MHAVRWTKKKAKPCTSIKGILKMILDIFDIEHEGNIQL